MKEVKDTLFSTANGARENVKKLVILINDGKATRSPLETARELREAGINIIVVGISKAVDVKELDEIAGGAGRAHLAREWHNLVNTTFIHELTDAVCQQHMEHML